MKHWFTLCVRYGQCLTVMKHWFRLSVRYGQCLTLMKHGFRLSVRYGQCRHHWVYKSCSTAVDVSRGHLVIQVKLIKWMDRSSNKDVQPPSVFQISSRTVSRHTYLSAYYVLMLWEMLTAIQMEYLQHVKCLTWVVWCLQLFLIT